MTRAEVLAEVERIIAEAVFENDEQPADAAERVLAFLDGIGYDASHELEHGPHSLNLAGE